MNDLGAVRNTMQQNPDVMAETHAVENVPPPLEDYDSWQNDAALREAVTAFGGGWGEPRLAEFGVASGSAERIGWGRQANENPPRLHTHDRYGHRVDEVEYHPAYHQLMTVAKANYLHALPWVERRAGTNVVRAALLYLQSQVEAGHGCPVVMTFACVPTLNKQPDIAAQWLPGITNPHYDPRNRVYTEKRGLTVGMAMTEKQGGSDVRANSTQALPLGAEGPGRTYELVGHKYFVSAPMSDAFLMLAYTERGLSCFLVPRWRPDGSRNALQIIRLKDKMGNVSNASCETELRGALGWMIGAEGRGVANIIEMVALTRFDCAVTSAAGMRQAAVQALHHCAYRSAFGARLAEQPLMQSVLADLALEAEAATWLGLRLAQALDRAEEDEGEALLARIGTAVAKYWNCKRAPGHAYEAMECIGGSGVMETTMMPRLYREAPVNAIWEGSGNVQCLDVLRAMHKSPETRDALLQEIGRAAGGHPALDAHLDALGRHLAEATTAPGRARSIVAGLALAWQASLLIQAGNAAVSDAYCAARLDGHGAAHHGLYGALPAGIDSRALMERAWPRIGVE
jgi:putative acyl-CoA dehydrogenase